MKQHGGKREGAGRKPKSDEIALIERLSPLDDLAYLLIEKGLKEGDTAVLKLFMEYRYGKPKQSMDLTSGGKQIKLPSWVDDKS